jgi:hypothetical protein
LNEITQNRTENDLYKKLKISQFLAIRLGPCYYVDVVAVSTNRVSSEKLQILIARRDSTPDDSNQANALKQVVVKHFINTSTKEQTEEQFSNDYLIAVLGWSSDRINVRLIALNYARANKPSAKSMARSEKLLSLKRFYLHCLNSPKAM